MQHLFAEPSELSSIYSSLIVKMADNKLLSEIAGEHKLKHAATKDASGPVIDKDAKIKHVDRTGLLSDISSEHQLKHAETKDASAPVIDKDVKLKTVDRSGLLNEIAAKKS